VDEEVAVAAKSEHQWPTDWPIIGSLSFQVCSFIPPNEKPYLTMLNHDNPGLTMMPW
jgi:hypothetical protein